jgi:hypothetical protein
MALPRAAQVSSKKRMSVLKKVTLKSQMSLDLTVYPRKDEQINIKNLMDDWGGCVFNVEKLYIF